MSRKKLYRPGHPLAPASGIINAARVVLYEAIGPGPHHCHWCGVGVRWGSSLFADHVDHDETNDAPANLVPSCFRCNVSRKKTNIQPGEPFIERRPGHRARAVSRVCADCGRAFFTTAGQVKNYGARFCSRACRNRTVAAESGAAIVAGELFIEVRKPDGRRKRLRATDLACDSCGDHFLLQTRFVTRSPKHYCCRRCAARGREADRRGRQPSIPRTP